MRLIVVLALLAGCAELGVITDDGTTVSVGKPSGGYLVAGARLPDKGEGFVTRDVWKARNNRYGTDELIDLVVGVARRMTGHVKDVKLVVADLSGPSGGASHLWHRSHQSGRDVDLLYYMRDATGKPFEADAMHVFDARGRARDGTGITVDVPRTWQLVRELLLADEAIVQWIFMYQPIANTLIEHAVKIGESPVVIARARLALRQPGDSARHDDHMHVRVYCSDQDRVFGCEDIGPMQLLAEREAERRRGGPAAAVVAALQAPPTMLAESTPTRGDSAPDEAALPSPAITASAMTSTMIQSIGRLLRTPTDRVYLRIWL